MTGELVPEDFDLDAARNARSTTPESEFDRCPECESATIHSKGTRHGRDRQFETEYVCRNCGEHFDDPLEAGHDA